MTAAAKQTVTRTVVEKGLTLDMTTETHYVERPTVSGWVRVPYTIEVFTEESQARFYAACEAEFIAGLDADELAEYEAFRAGGRT